jgi:putative endonuclease
VDNSRTGRWGEEQAARFLEARGWTILERNLRSGRKEVDLVARKNSVVAFVEVKCRRGPRFGHPLDAITPAKQREIGRVARDWLRGRSLGSGIQIRFDAVSVYWPPGASPRVEHIQDAWRLG